MTKTVLTSGAALAASGIVENANLNDIAGTVVQVLIGLITIFKLFKKQKDDNTPKNNI